MAPASQRYVLQLLLRRLRNYLLPARPPACLRRLHARTHCPPRLNAPPTDRPPYPPYLCI